MGNHMLHIFEKLIQATVICSIGICILLLLKKYLFKNFSKRFNYYIWLIIVFRMLFFLFNYTIIYEVKESKNNFFESNIEKINIPMHNSFIFYVACLWILVITIIAIYTFVKYIRFKNFIVDVSYDIKNDDVICIYNSLLLELNIEKKVVLRGSDELISPAGMGLFKSYIFLPDYSYSKDELSWILKHELMHFKNKDILIKFLMLFVKIIYWFNPLVYIMSNRVNLDCELCCDESVLRNCSSKERKEYALALIKSVKLSKNYQNRILTTEFNKTNLEKRLESIAKKKSKSGILIALILICIYSITYFNIETISFDNFNTLGTMGIINDKKANPKGDNVLNRKVIYSKY
ncbi:M56 family metallopeptidase [Clostridioides difficile]|nr:M56 family metallopeptidase [Clostridioides difficile]